MCFCLRYGKRGGISGILSDNKTRFIGSVILKLLNELLLQAVCRQGDTTMPANIGKLVREFYFYTSASRTIPHGISLQARDHVPASKVDGIGHSDKRFYDGMVRSTMPKSNSRNSKFPIKMPKCPQHQNEKSSFDTQKT